MSGISEAERRPYVQETVTLKTVNSDCKLCGASIEIRDRDYPGAWGIVSAWAKAHMTECPITHPLSSATPNEGEKQR